MKGEGNLSFQAVKSHKGLTNGFYCGKKVEKIFWFCDLFIFKRDVFASSLIRGGSSKAITPTLRTTSPRLLEHRPTRGLLMKVDHNVHNEL